MTYNKEGKVSSLLTERVFETRPLALGRTGMTLHTDCGDILEVSGGSHATCIVNDDGQVLDRALHRFDGVRFALTGRGARHWFQEELAERVCRLFGSLSSRVFFTSGGTEAMETACRLAYHIQKLRGKSSTSILIGRMYSYHGMSLLTRNIAYHPIHSEIGFGLDFHWPKLPEPRCVRCPLGLTRDLCSFDCAGIITEIIDKFGADTIAAVIIEPVSGSTGGALVPPLGYLERLSEICKSHGIILIADETVTAFGRTGDPFVANDKLADIVVGGKCLGGGFIPINAVIVTPHICDELADAGVDVPLRLTFSGNPLACLIACSAQEYIAENDLFYRVSKNSVFIRDKLTEECSRRSLESVIYGKGHLWAVEVPIKMGHGRALAKLVRDIAAQHGIEFMGGSSSSNERDFVHFMFTPPFDAAVEEIKSGISGVIKTLAEARETENIN